MTLKKLSEIFNRAIENDSNYQAALDIVKQNSYGNIWLIGGAVYRTLIRLLYKEGGNPKDFDFIVQRKKSILDLPNRWKLTYSRFSNPKLVYKDKQIDIIPLDKCIAITKRNLRPTISNFTSGCPFSIHCVIYNVNKRRLEGKKGIEALEQKVVEINNPEMARIYANAYHTKINQIIKKLAKELGFKPKFI